MEVKLMNNSTNLQLVAFQGEQELTSHSGSIENTMAIASELDADIFTIKDPENPAMMIVGERVSPEDIEWEEITIH